jgi:hypothetical protein
MPSPIPYNYPHLGNLDGINESGQPYMTSQRDFGSIPDHQEFEQHHEHNEMPRYPSPPPGPSENPYNAQQLVDATLDNRLEMPADVKSESDPASPGRSKPVPKPDREVTKDANGRFYCNWPNCTEEIRDFGRKCEWR